MRSALVFLICCLCVVARAGETCGSEIKLLLDPSTVDAVVKSLNAGSGTTRQVLLYDTAKLDLLSRGIIVRVRTGSDPDLMVKVRIPTERSLSAADGIAKCEIDRTGDSAVRSYSITIALAGEVPNSGIEVLRLLSPAQKQLLEQAHVPLDWSRMERVATIESTVWRTGIQPEFGKLALELWKWPAGQVLELSTKAADDGASTQTQLLRLANDKRLAVSPIQKTKTEIVLRDLRRTAAP